MTKEIEGLREASRALEAASKAFVAADIKARSKVTIRLTIEMRNKLRDMIDATNERADLLARQQEATEKRHMSRIT